MRKAGAIVVGLVLLAVALGAVLLAIVDPNDHKALIARWAGDALGGRVVIDGPIELTPSLTPTLVVNGLSLAGDDAGAAGPASITIGRAEVSVVLSSVLFGPLHLPRVKIDTAKLELPLPELAAGRRRPDAGDRPDRACRTSRSTTRAAAASLSRASFTTRPSRRRRAPRAST